MNEHRQETFIEKLDRIVPDKLLLIATLTGCAGILCEFVHDKHKPDELPPMVGYAMTILAGNMIAIIADHEVLPLSKDFSSYRMSEQSQETILRVMKIVVTDLYKSIQEEPC